MKKPETKVVHSIIEAIQKEYPNSYLRKIHGNPFQHAGIPDIVGCINGRFIGLEVKTNSGKITLIQQLEGSLILEAGGIYGVVRSSEEALNLIETALKVKVIR